MNKKISIELREVVDADLAALFEHQRDPEAVAMAAFPARDRPAFDSHWAKIRADPACMVRTILCDAHVAGNIGSWDQSGNRMIGYWIGREFWGRGVATKALAEYLSHETARPLYAWVAKENVGSIRVLEKCGFTPSEEDLGSSEIPGYEVEEVLMELRAVTSVRGVHGNHPNLRDVEES